eukprot:CAMPEP_0115320828 /NCGR_PEP_ID=MMETSP0270-20121206/80529_1 /TAXON_ID=71861 /ORGANISM="Scrippsiella trochoidea, Strain CCMP3099" /LENGTH=48 /DNA_ID= /DNA_START= /DNA_END= /DNA_ORIENTATION=
MAPQPRRAAHGMRRAGRARSRRPMQVARRWKRVRHVASVQPPAALPGQ